MRIVFFGANELGYDCCEALLLRGHEIAGILTIPRRFRISYSPDAPVTNVLYRDFHELGQRFGVPVIDVPGDMASFTDAVRGFSPDLIVVIGWYYMIPKTMRELAPKGCVGIHGSLLPLYRGGAPLVWAIINGEREAGVTLFHFSSGVDDGDIIAQKAFPIEVDETIAEVLEKAKRASVNLVTEFVPQLLAGTAPRVPQDHAKATHVPQRSPKDGEIDWSWDGERIRNFIRAQTRPYPGAFTIIGDKRVTIWSADVASRGE